MYNLTQKSIDKYISFVVNIFSTVYHLCTVGYNETGMLKPFRRHTLECLYGPTGTPEKGPDKDGLLTRGLKADKRRGWPHCKCPVWFSGTWNGRTFPRQSLGINDWKTAERKLHEKMNESDKQLQAVGQPHPITLEDALTQWQQAAKQNRLAERTMTAYASFADHAFRWANAHHINTVIAFDTRAMRAWRAEWCSKRGVPKGESRPLAETTERTRLTYAIQFFDFCHREGWIQKSPLADVRLPPVRPATKEDTTPIDTEPDSDENYRRIIATVPIALARNEHVRGMRPTELRASIPHVLAFLRLIYEGGFRCSDALVFDPDNIVVEDGCAEYTYTQIKTKRQCTTILPLDVAAEVKALPRLSSGLPFFSGPGKWDAKSPCATAPLRQNGSRVNFFLKKIGDMAGVPNLHAHRFRNSYAVNRLNAGYSIEYVSTTLGHASVKTTQDYYAPWVKSRRAALRRAYLAGERRGTLIQMPRASNA